MSTFADEAKEAHAAIKKMLHDEWDPIGISDLSEAQDEYDAYVPEVYRLLSRRAELREIFEYLWWLETKHMGLNGDLQRTEMIAERLAKLISAGVLPGTEQSETS